MDDNKIKKSKFQNGFEPITSEQMYQIENNGEKIIGMKKLLMMENAGSKIAEFILEVFGDNLVIRKLFLYVVWEIMEAM